MSNPLNALFHELWGQSKEGVYDKAKWIEFQALLDSTVRPATGTVEELRAIASWIRTPGNIWREDAIDECARVLENRADSIAVDK